jgi:hypothetical protein
VTYLCVGKQNLFAAGALANAVDAGALANAVDAGALANAVDGESAADNRKACRACPGMHDVHAVHPARFPRRRRMACGAPWETVTRARLDLYRAGASPAKIDPVGWCLRQGCLLGIFRERASSQAARAQSGYANRYWLRNRCLCVHTGSSRLRVQDYRVKDVLSVRGPGDAVCATL